MSKLHSFSVGLRVAFLWLLESGRSYRHAAPPHTFTLQEGLFAVAEVVHHLETYDGTTIKHTPMFLMSRKIKGHGRGRCVFAASSRIVKARWRQRAWSRTPSSAPGVASHAPSRRCRVDDIIHAGPLRRGRRRNTSGRACYFHKAPNKQELHAELIDKVAQLNTTACARTSRRWFWGVEAHTLLGRLDFWKWP